MAHIEVHAADISDGTIEQLRVKMHGLPERTIDRDTALSWMKDGHSLLPIVGGKALHALQLVEVGDDDTPFIRFDNDAEAADALPELPSV